MISVVDLTFKKFCLREDMLGGFHLEIVLKGGERGAKVVFCLCIICQLSQVSNAKGGEYSVKGGQSCLPLNETLASMFLWQWA